MASPFEIEIINRTRSCPVDDELLRQTARGVLQALQVARASLSIAVVNDAVMRPIKKQYFGDSVTTDVVSFNLMDDTSSGEAAQIDGEIIINAQQADRAAIEHGTDPAGELHLYLIHGLLHLLGYDDQTERQAMIMRQKENEMLKQCGIHIGGVERSNR